MRIAFLATHEESVFLVFDDGSWVCVDGRDGQTRVMASIVPGKLKIAALTSNPDWWIGLGYTITVIS